MITTIIFLLVLTFLVFIHELGHFLAAKSFKIRVDEFAIGFPPRVFSFVKRGTRFALNIIPLGGYVKIHGESENDELTTDSILSKPRWQQAVVLIAGVTFNVIATWLLLSLAFMFGTRSAVEGFPAEKVTDKAVVLMLATPGSPAAVAGLEAGDTVVAVESSVASLSVASSSLTVAAVQNVISSASGTVMFTVEKASTQTSGNNAKDGAYKIYEVTPKDGVVPGKKAVGISMQDVGTVKLGFFESFTYGAKSSWNLLQNVAVGLYDFIVKIFTSDSGAKAALNSVSGPVGIASIVGSSARQGFSALLVITAIISANLAVLNLVPFPALDGGRLLIVAIEGTIRRRLNPKIVGWVNAIGFLLLIGLMIVVTFKDIFALF